MDLFLLIVSVALAVLAFVAGSAIKREHAAARAAAGASRPRELGHYELAYLAGGPDRVADTAIALLADAGHLRVSRGGRVHQVHASVSREPVEEAVLGIVASRSGLPVSALRIEITRTLAMDALRRHLAELGLIHPEDAFAQAGRLAVRLRAVSVLALAGFAVAALTVAIQGVNLPGALALTVLAVTVVGAEVDIRRHKRAARVMLTPPGQEALDAARRDNAWGVAEGPIAIALYGLDGLRNIDLRSGLTAGGDRGRRRRGGAYAGGSGGCGGGGCGSPSSTKSTGDGSSSDGGSSGCGGGCGGGG